MCGDGGAQGAKVACRKEKRRRNTALFLGGGDDVDNEQSKESERRPIVTAASAVWLPCPSTAARRFTRSSFFVAVRGGDW